LFCLFASLFDRSLRLLANTLIFATLAATCGMRSAAIVSKNRGPFGFSIDYPGTDSCFGANRALRRGVTQFRKARSLRGTSFRCA